MVVGAGRIGQQFVRAYACGGNHPAKDAADGREHQALDEELPDDARPSGSQCEADGDLAGPADRASQLQIREIGTGDQQHETNRAPNRAIEFGGVGADESPEVHNAGMDIFIGERVRALEPASDGIHFRLGAATSDSVGDAAESEPKNTGFALLEIVARHRDPKIYPVVREVKAGRHDADNGCGSGIQAYDLSHHRSVTCVAALPEPVGKNGHCGRARGFIGRCEVASQNRLLPEHLEAVGTQLSSVASLITKLIAKDEPQTAVGHNCHALEGLCLRAPILKIGIRDAAVGRDVENTIVRIHMRESAEEDGIRDGEYGRIDSDAKSKYRDRDGRKSGILAQRSKTKSNVAKQIH